MLAFVLAERICSHIPDNLPFLFRRNLSLEGDLTYTQSHSHVENANVAKTTVPAKELFLEGRQGQVVGMTRSDVVGTGRAGCLEGIVLVSKTGGQIGGRVDEDLHWAAKTVASRTAQ